ncbi:collagen-like protein [Arundinibacter roseus]|uniref:Collagen-like protein n=1 Tax=Arundinibacter roseus TaxID=2070510 RepID=A0A4R4KCE1_9BACT|nr:collagen-like protein [Arundinibacter roseus]TDB64452.1 collagen-like protein [Arundinibacter roseus]
MTRKLLYALMIGLLPFLYSCEGPQGEIGPQGPAGPQGVAGEKGEPGESSGSGAFQFSTGEISTDEEGDVSFSLELNEDVAASVEKGVVLVYAKSGNLWFPLPGIVFFGEEIANFTFVYGLDGVDLTFFLLQTTGADARTFQDIRIVLVPAINGRLNAEIDYKDYNAVKKAFNLAD